MSPSNQFLRRGVIGLTIAAVACAGGEVASPVKPPRSALGVSTSDAPEHGIGRDSVSDDRPDAPRPVRCAPHSPVVGRGVFGPSGGTLVVGNSLLLIPGGALRDTVTITGTALGDSSSTVTFQPHGLLFFKPAALALSSDGCAIPAAGSPSIGYLSGGVVLETIEATYLPRYKIVAAPIRHFSGYAILF